MWTLVISLILIGLLLIVLEILVVPGGIAGVIGFISMAVGIYLSYSRIGIIEGSILLGSTIAINAIALVLVFRSKTWEKIMLKKNIDAKVNLIDEEIVKEGEEGKTISRCAPMGKASFDKHIYEVQSQSEFIDENVDIVIIKVERSKIIVKPKK